MRCVHFVHFAAENFWAHTTGARVACVKKFVNSVHSLHSGILWMEQAIHGASWERCKNFVSAFWACIGWRRVSLAVSVCVCECGCLRWWTHTGNNNICVCSTGTFYTDWTSQPEVIMSSHDLNSDWMELNWTDNELEITVVMMTFWLTSKNHWIKNGWLKWKTITSKTRLKGKIIKIGTIKWHQWPEWP